MTPIISQPNLFLPQPPTWTAGDRQTPQRQAWDDKVTLSDQARGLPADLHPLSERVSRIGQHTSNAAQRVMTDLAKQLFGDKGDFQISFDSTELSAESTFSAAWQKTTHAEGSSEAAGIRLNESSHFVGRGHITTADGQQFEFEIEVQFERTFEAVASQTRNTDVAVPASDAAAKPAGNLQTVFAGSAAELLQRLTDTPIGTPFQWEQSGEDGPIQRAGKMFLRLLDLTGPCHVDCNKATNPSNLENKPRLDVRA